MAFLIKRAGKNEFLAADSFGPYIATRRLATSFPTRAAAREYLAAIKDSIATDFLYPTEEARWPLPPD
jgi:hypothetical protein